MFGRKRRERERQERLQREAEWDKLLAEAVALLGEVRAAQEELARIKRNLEN